MSAEYDVARQQRLRRALEAIADAYGFISTFRSMEPGVHGGLMRHSTFHDEMRVPNRRRSERRRRKG
jgi:hypothetical protein